MNDVTAAAFFDELEKIGVDLKRLGQLAKHAPPTGGAYNRVRGFSPKRAIKGSPARQRLLDRKPVLIADKQKHLDMNKRVKKQKTAPDFDVDYSWMR